MKRTMLALLVGALTLTLTACPQLAESSRNTAAALNGAIVAAQSSYQASCTAQPTGAACVAINKAIDGENALITATEAYCGWSTAAPPPDPTAACVPVASAQAGLQTAIANANLFIVELKGLTK